MGVALARAHSTASASRRVRVGEPCRVQVGGAPDLLEAEDVAEPGTERSGQAFEALQLLLRRLVLERRQKTASVPSRPGPVETGSARPPLRLNSSRAASSSVYVYSMLTARASPRPAAGRAARKRTPRRQSEGRHEGLLVGPAEGRAAAADSLN